MSIPNTAYNETKAIKNSGGFEDIVASRRYSKGLDGGRDLDLNA